MEKTMAKFSIWVIFSLIFVSFSASFAQENADKEKKNDARQQQDEIILDEIQIEGVIEKPNVAILPTREHADFDSVTYGDRSFAKELRALPEKAFLFDSNFDSIKRIKNLKEAIKRITELSN